MQDGAGAPNDRAVVIPEGKDSIGGDFNFEDYVEAAHFAADGVGRMPDAAAECFAPVDQEAWLIVQDFPARLRQMRADGRIPFGFGSPAAVFLADRQRPR